MREKTKAMGAETETGREKWSKERQRQTEMGRDRDQETHGQTERGRRQRRDPWRGAETVAERRETETDRDGGDA